MRLESPQAPPFVTVNSLAAGEDRTGAEETPDHWEKSFTQGLLEAAEVHA